MAESLPVDLQNSVASYSIHGHVEVTALRSIHLALVQVSGTQAPVLSILFDVLTLNCVSCIRIESLPSRSSALFLLHLPSYPRPTSLPNLSLLPIFFSFSLLCISFVTSRSRVISAVFQFTPPREERARYHPSRNNRHSTHNQHAFLDIGYCLDGTNCSSGSSDIRRLDPGTSTRCESYCKLLCSAFESSVEDEGNRRCSIV